MTVPPQPGLHVPQRPGIGELPVAAGHPIVEGERIAVPVPADQAPSMPLSVGVIVDLFQTASAGGHVKTWEKLAHAACGEPLDLTVYFFGSDKKELPLAENVRYVHVPPVWSTASLPFLDGIPAHTDLAPLHPGALWRFRRHHVLHATDAYFSLARSARMLSRWSSRALVHSTHTDTPGYTRVYTDQVLRRLCGDGWLGRTLRERWRLPERMGRRMHRRLERYLRRCDWALAPDENGIRQLAAAISSERTSLLRRGIDTELFHPARRDRARLQRTYGIPPDCAVLLFAGRIDGGKDVLTLARAARILLDRGLSLHVICAGEGSQMQRVRDLLGERVSLPGQVSQEDLAWLYASADLFVFCSQIEIFPNVILEAKSSGLPAVVSAHGGSEKLVRHSAASGDADGVSVAGNDPEVWAREIELLLRAPERRHTMGEAARRFVENSWPSWRQVLREDLLPVWQFVARARGLLA
jgi:glycosyltransferase involved in cell wall biosynthesis